MIKKKVVLCVLLVAAVCGTSAYASKNDSKKKGYRFTVEINNASDSVIYLGQYYNKNQYAIDTAFINKKGQFIFEKKDKELKPGLYFITNNKNKLAEFTINKEPLNYKFYTDDANWTLHMEIKGSKDNEKFMDYQQIRRDMNMAMEEARQKYSDEEFKSYRREQGRKLDSINKAFVAQDPNHILSIIMSATKEIDVPVVDSLGDSLSQREQYEYYATHYFDNMALDNEAILRTPAYVFYERVERYFDQVVNGATPETICKYADMLLEKARPAKDVFKYLVLYIAEKYLQTNIMSYDAIYVHMIEKYYMTGDAFWASPSDIDFETKRAMTWKKLLIGEKAPELILKNQEGEWHSFYEVPNKYTLLIFWAPSCGHCATIIPALYNFYKEYKDVYDIGAYAINTDIGPEEVEKWKKYVQDKGLDWDNYNGGEANVDWHEVYDIISTPVIYLLDQDKKIIGKKLDADILKKLFAILEPEKTKIANEQKTAQTTTTETPDETKENK